MAKLQLALFIRYKKIISSPFSGHSSEVDISNAH